MALIVDRSQGSSGGVYLVFWFLSLFFFFFFYRWTLCRILKEYMALYSLYTYIATNEK